MSGTRGKRWAPISIMKSMSTISPSILIIICWTSKFRPASSTQNIREPDSSAQCESVGVHGALAFGLESHDPIERLIAATDVKPFFRQ